MSKTKVLFLASLCALVVAACLTYTPIELPVATGEPGIPVTGVALVQSVDIQILEYQPLQANAIVRGQLPDAGCTTISAIDQVREGDIFRITLATRTDPLPACAPAATPFEQVISLDVLDSPPARYSVHVHGLEQSFELLSRDAFQFKQMLVGALNAKDYNLLRVLMGDSLMIAHWQSEGTAYTPDLAIEQLQSSLLNPVSPLQAEHSKNLIELLGADPLLLVEPQVVEASPLFVAGWGAEGKGESILFVARQPDGSLYWHGLLHAKEGFKPAIANQGSRPVEVGVYGTSVQYVQAQEEVLLYDGPDFNFGVIGNLTSGQSAKVTGSNVSGTWWRVVCPDGSAGSCWVQADPKLTPPAAPPQANLPSSNPAAIPSISIVAVACDDQVTVLGENYPAHTELKVRMGESGTSGINGIVVEHLNSGDGGTFMATFAIPAELYGEKQIAIRLESENGYYSYNWFDNDSSVIASTSVVPQSTNVNYILAQKDVSIYTGPSKNDSIIGSIDKGQRIKVTGISADGTWWRVICPDGTAGSCWVSAKSKFTKPSS
jgi:uncharacterized protein YraI